jgi:phosphoribosylformylglycinamidine cyclo-ligase
VTGVVERDAVLTGTDIVAGDVIYGVASSGLHTNGWSLARKLLFDMGTFDIEATPPELGGRTLAEVLLSPHANYVAPIRRALDAKIQIKAMAHITGGGLVENTPRVLAVGLGARIDVHSWEPQAIFAMMQKLGQLDREEMHKVFNMGIGLAVIGPAGQLSALREAFAPFQVWKIGRVEAGLTGTVLEGEA